MKPISTARPTSCHFNIPVSNNKDVRRRVNGILHIPVDCSGDVLKTLAKRLKSVLQAKLEEIDIKYEARVLSLARPTWGSCEELEERMDELARLYVETMKMRRALGWSTLGRAKALPMQASLIGNQRLSDETPSWGPVQDPAIFP